MGEESKDKKSKGGYPREKRGSYISTQTGKQKLSVSQLVAVDEMYCGCSSRCGLCVTERANTCELQHHQKKIPEE